MEVLCAPESCWPGCKLGIRAGFVVPRAVKLIGSLILSSALLFVCQSLSQHKHKTSNYIMHNYSATELATIVLKQPTRRPSNL